MRQIESLWQEVRDLTLGNTSSVHRLHAPPAPLEFLRDFVSLNKPCLISKAATAHWPASALWRDRAHLTRALSSSSVTVHLTPNGRADSLAHIDSSASSPPPPPLCFASAHAQRVPFAEALEMISRSSRESNFVAYAQQQNDCFRSEYGPLARDCDEHVPWASEALGSLPEAVNLWIGNHFSETSFHKDHYENLYAVVTGEKHFLLLPPTDVHRMYIKDYLAAQYLYSKETGEFKLEVEEPIRYVPWCSVNPYPSPENLESEIAKFPLYFNGPKPFECTVKAGEILYLPSMWFHHVRQIPDDTGLTIAVNYWYDMQFDMKYAYFNFLQSIEYQPIHEYPVTEGEAEDMVMNKEDGSTQFPGLKGPRLSANLSNAWGTGSQNSPTDAFTPPPDWVEGLQVQKATDCPWHIIEWFVVPWVRRQLLYGSIILGLFGESEDVHKTPEASLVTARI